VFPVPFDIVSIAQVAANVNTFLQKKNIFFLLNVCNIFVTIEQVAQINSYMDPVTWLHGAGYMRDGSCNRVTAVM